MSSRLDYKSLSNRIKSFHNYTGDINPIDIACFGFYHDKQDILRCLYCNNEYIYEPKSDFWQEHQGHTKIPILALHPLQGSEPASNRDGWCGWATGGVHYCRQK